MPYQPDDYFSRHYQTANTDISQEIEQLRDALREISQNALSRNDADLAVVGDLERPLEGIAPATASLGVLYEKPGRQAGQMIGKSDHLHAVHVTHPEGQVGQLLRVRITGSASNSLAATTL